MWGDVKMLVSNLPESGFIWYLKEYIGALHYRYRTFKEL